ncbi:MAG: DUF2855 family protein [Micropepsaceae bacterium]
MTTSTDFLVNRKNLNETRFVDTPLTLQGGQALIRVGDFALTANNITYGAFGDAMMYWNFFPALEGWGRIPVWGFGDVIESRSEGLKAGERLYGYFPMSTHLVIEPARITPANLFDGAAHRQKMASVYNNYIRVAADPGYVASREAQQALLRPLFTTSFLIEDLLADNDFYGARQIVLSSASSKTSLGLAFLLHTRRKGQVKIIGLTSKSNAAFVNATGYYDQIASYDAISSLDATTPAVFVDMAGNGDVRASVHRHWVEALKYSCAVGATHWDNTGTQSALPGPRPQMFFAPDRVKKRSQDWGPGGLDKHLSEAWSAFNASVDSWMKVTKGHGRGEVERVYREMVAGKSPPDTGYILSL